MIRTSRHSVSSTANQNKLNILEQLFIDYKYDVELYVNKIINFENFLKKLIKNNCNMPANNNQNDIEFEPNGNQTLCSFCNITVPFQCTNHKLCVNYCHKKLDQLSILLDYVENELIKNEKQINNDK